MTRIRSSALDSDTAGIPSEVERTPVRLSATATLLAAQEAALTLLASQKAVAELLRSHNVEGAVTLLETQIEAALSLLEAQESVAELLRSHNVEGAATLRETQEDEALTLLTSQKAVAELLRSPNEEGSGALLEAEERAAWILSASQIALTEFLRSRDEAGAEILLKAQYEASQTLLACQKTVSKLLRSHNVEGAATLLAAQEEAASSLQAAQQELAQYFRSHTVEIAAVKALNAELEQRVNERTEEMTRANSRLEAATLAKSDFLSSMSHELRTPLNSIIGFSGLLMTGMVGDLQPEQKKQIEMINASGMHLLDLVNQVLDLSAVEAGHIKLTRKPLDVSLAVSDVVESLAPLASAAELELSFDVSPAVNTMVTDHLRLEQVLFNIVGNAIKFTDSGSVRIDVRRDDGEIVFAVTDTGRGIPAEELSRVFDEFYRVEHPDATRAEGTGIGLTVSMRLVELLGGTLRANSTFGEGTTFTVRLPVE